MAEIDADAICAAVQTRLRAFVTDLKEVSWPPPGKGPAQGPAAWIDYGPTVIEQGGLEIAHHTIQITVATPDKGEAMYADAYKTVLAVARQCQKAFRGDAQIAGEAIVEAGATISEGINGTYMGTPVVTRRVTLLVQTLDEVTNQITP